MNGKIYHEWVKGFCFFSDFYKEKSVPSNTDECALYLNTNINQKDKHFSKYWNS